MTRNGLSRLLVAALAVLALVAASCGDDAEPAAPDTSAADAAALEQAQAEAAAAQADADTAAAEAGAAADAAAAAEAKAAEAGAALEAAMAEAVDPDVLAGLEADLEAAQAEAAAAMEEAEAAADAAAEAEAAVAAAEAAAAAAAAEEAMTYNPDGVLVVGQNFFPNQQASLDPRIMSTSTNAEFLNEIYAALVRRDAITGEYSPYLAESYEVVDSQTLTVTIRADANFHDGRPVTAADAKASIEATKANTEERTCNCNRGIALLDSVEVVDDKTFTVHLAQPGLATLFELLIGPEFMISPADAGAEQATAPIGNGPFRFVELIEGQRITLEKWDDFFAADEIMLDGLVFVNLEEGTTQLNALLAGDIDMAMELDFPTFEAVEDRAGFSGAAVQSDTTFIWFVGCQAPGAFYEDIRVRQGFMHALDRNLLNAALYGGDGVPTVGMYPPGHPYNDPALEEVYPFDIDRARELFEEAGVAGQTVGVWATSSIPESVDLVLLMNVALSRAGVTVEPIPTDDLVGDYLRPASLDPGPFDLEHDATILIQSRPGMQKLTRNFLNSGITNPCDTEYDRVTEIINELYGLAPDNPRAIELWHEIQRINVEEARHMILAFYPSYMAWNSDKVGGVNPNSFGGPIEGGYTFHDMFINP